MRIEDAKNISPWNSNVKKLLTNRKKKNVINKWTTYFFFVINDFVNFSQHIYIFFFQNSYTILKILLPKTMQGHNRDTFYKKNIRNS